MEPGNDQYCSDRNNNLYIYTSCRPVCSDNNNGYRSHNAGHANVHPDRTTVPEQHGTSTSCNIHQWHNRNLEPGNDQHCNGRNNNLYLYTGCRPVRNYGNDGCNDHDPGHTNIHADRTTLSEQHCACTYRQHPPMVSQEPGARQRSVLQRSEQRLIPLPRLQASAEATATMDIVITTQVTPTFTQIGPLCQNTYSTCTSCNIHQWHHRNMEPGNDQYSNARNNNLYIYPSCRPVR